jgi:hypothetical protein
MGSQIQNWLTSLTQQSQAIINSGMLVSTNTAVPANLPVLAPQLEIKRPWLDPPEGYAPYDYQASATLPAVGAGSTVPQLTGATGATAVVDTNGLGLIVDNGYDGVINSLSCNFTGAGFTDFSGQIIWILFADSKPIRNFNNIQAQKGTVQIPRDIAPIRIYSGQTITWVVIHASNPSLNGEVVCTLTGYVYPNRG